MERGAPPSMNPTSITRARPRRIGDGNGGIGSEATGETALFLHCLDRHGHSELGQQTSDIERNLSVSSTTFPFLPWILSRMEELSASQSLTQRVFHQIAKGLGKAG